MTCLEITHSTAQDQHLDFFYSSIAYYLPIPPYLLPISSPYFNDWFSWSSSLSYQFLCAFFVTSFSAIFYVIFLFMLFLNYMCLGGMQNFFSVLILYYKLPRTYIYLQKLLRNIFTYKYTYNKIKCQFLLRNHKKIKCKYSIIIKKYN